MRQQRRRQQFGDRPSCRRALPFSRFSAFALRPLRRFAWELVNLLYAPTHRAWCVNSKLDGERVLR